jgi:hypothetical protein
MRDNVSLAVKFGYKWGGKVAFVLATTSMVTFMPLLFEIAREQQVRLRFAFCIVCMSGYIDVTMIADLRRVPIQFFVFSSWQNRDLFVHGFSIIIPLPSSFFVVVVVAPISLSSHVAFLFFIFLLSYLKDVGNGKTTSQRLEEQGIQ